MARCLADLREGESAEVSAVRASGALRQRLFDLGIVRGAVVRVERHAPFGDPVEIAVGATRIALRREEAGGVFVADAPAEDASS
ncbi:MAG: FeoA family protein [Planctomycetota bacterium]